MLFVINHIIYNLDKYLKISTSDLIDTKGKQSFSIDMMLPDRDVDNIWFDTAKERDNNYNRLIGSINDFYMIR